MTDAVGLALLGCGPAGQHLVQAAGTARLRWVGCWDPDPRVAAGVAAGLGLPTPGALDDLLADPAVEAVVVAAAIPDRVGLAEAAFAAGKHVLLETPAGFDLEALDRLEATRPAGCLGAGCTARFRGTPSAAVIARTLQTGAIGPLRRLAAEVAYPAPVPFDATEPAFLADPGWAGHGALFAWGLYDFDYLLGLCGFAVRPRQVVAQLDRLPAGLREQARPANDGEVSGEALVRCDGGVTLSWRRSFAAWGEPRNRWWLEGEQGALDLCMMPGAPQALWHRYDGTAPQVLVPTADSWPAIQGGVIADFVAAVRSGTPPLTPLAEVVRLQRLAAAIEQSAATGTAITLPPEA